MTKSTMSKPAPTQIAVRCYTEVPDSKTVSDKSKRPRLDTPSEWALVFDCETTIDASQALRVGVFQVRKNGALNREGLFFDAESLSDTDIATILAYADAKDLEPLSNADFATDVFLKVGYHWQGSIIGFNLPFDISRIALSHSEARGSMHGGFSVDLTGGKHDPRVRVKHLSRRAALFDFAAPATQNTGHSDRKRNIINEHHRGYFVDVKSLAVALTSRSFTLAGLCRHLKTDTQKLATDEHGGPITPDYLDYARADVQATWECFKALADIYSTHSLDTPLHRILSEASIGKAYLKQMGIKPLLACQPGIPRSLFGKIMCAYYGGRAEVRTRREIREVLYVDYKSMYPTVNSLMGLWDFVIADGMTWADTTTETQEFLTNVTLADFQTKDTWKRLRTLVRIKPDKDIVPVRAKYDGKVNTIGLNYLTFEDSLWYTLADVVTSKLLTGKPPTIEEAITFTPGPPQKDLKPVDLFGNPDYRVDPCQHDVFNRFIDLRDGAKANGDPNEKAIKIIANASSYGIFIEIQRDDVWEKKSLNVYGPDGEGFITQSKALEQPGKFFHPLLGVLITGAARLMLAMAERLTLDRGLKWVFCDTDSLAIARPEGMERGELETRAKFVIDWFVPLNPYEKAGSILKIEDINYEKDTNALEPLYCLAISAKRYSLFNIDKDGKPVLRKASAHGLGHLMEPYSQDAALPELPKPQFPLHEIGVKRWQHDLWVKIIEAALNGHSDRVTYDWHPALRKPALSRYGATSPALLAWMRHYNADKPYRKKVRPFGFLVSPMARNGLFAAMPEPKLVEPHKRGRPKKVSCPKPIAPFDTDPGQAVAKAFDRETGELVSADQLKTYAEVLCQYHLSSENKFENGAFTDQGETWRRHVKANSFVLIGKEANKVGDSGEEEPSLSGPLTIFQ